MKLPKKPTPAGYGWGGLVLYVLAIDVLLLRSGKWTLSSAFRDAAHHPYRRWPVTFSWTLLTAHLFTESRFDPLSWAGDRLAGKATS